MTAARLALPLLALLLAACGSEPIRPPPPKKPRIYVPPAPPRATPAPQPKLPVVRSGGDVDGPPAAHEIPQDLHLIPDAVPVAEPKSASGNPASYEVYGKTYKVKETALGYVERGKASWYGRKFHGRRTSSGEPYNMFAMTAAHKSLPIPSYVRVTNIANGRSCVVRVNDRGPFHPGRIIDLSYTAADRLGMLDHGEAAVEVRAIVPGSAPPITADARYLEVGAFNDPLNAYSLGEELASLGTSPVEIRSETRNASAWHRVLVGPFQNLTRLESTRRSLEALQFAVTPVPD